VAAAIRSAESAWPWHTMGIRRDHGALAARSGDIPEQGSRVSRETDARPRQHRRTGADYRVHFPCPSPGTGRTVCLVI